MTRIAVVIPFYQRQGGILSRALRSVASQVVPDDTIVHVLIVDDGSPSPPRIDLDACGDPPSWLTIDVIEQPNAGPAAARNRGLDAVPPDTMFVAFLDSDDWWRPRHLATALACLEEDADFFFCDSQQDENRTEFSNVPVMNDLVRRGIVQPSPVRADIFYFGDGAASALMTRHCVAHTSTVVYRWAPAGYRWRALSDLRFDRTLRFAGEDHLMWIMLALRARGVGFSTQVNSVRGRGVDLFRDDQPRVSAANIRREACRFKTFGVVAATPGIPPRTAAIAREQQAAVLDEIARITLHPSGLVALLTTGTREVVTGTIQAAGFRLPAAWLRVLLHGAIGSTSRRSGVTVEP